MTSQVVNDLRCRYNDDPLPYGKGFVIKNGSYLSQNRRRKVVDIIKNIRVIGGSEDRGRIFVQSRDVFPGLGGYVRTKYPIICAVRNEWGAEKGHRHKLFFRHLICKKLDDLWLKLGEYLTPHISRPFGSFSGADGSESYIYQWSPGCETFPWEVAEWEMVDVKISSQVVKLDEWQEFVGAFHRAGIDMERGVSMPDSRNYQNIIHGDGNIKDAVLNADWKRIDFDEESVGIDYKKLAEFWTQNRRQIEKELDEDRFRLLIGAIEFLTDNNPDMEDLADLTLKYRLSALEHSYLMQD